ncbi:MAG: hypothetical protein QGF59_14015 [Pirellulaceae bacterium]|jgi:hypothetical protein|nr:hypothetical protein [Pirellulaceae bacterium]MDP6719772.1 hypothetical protein [Pirellulaceae bacterium]
MTQLSQSSEPAVSKLLEADENDLYRQLASRVEAIKSDPLESANFDAAGVDPAKIAGLGLDLLSLGKRIFNRWNREAHALLCGGDPDDQQQREELSNAFELGDVAIAACISGLLISSFGLAPAIATVISAILVKRFLKGAFEEFCDAWRESLPAST